MTTLTSAGTLSVSDVARRAGVSPNAVRLYERYGVVTAERTARNARRFTIDAVCRIKLAKAAQRVGLTLKDSSEILAQIPPLTPDLSLWAAASAQLVEAAESRMDELRTAVAEYADPGFLKS